MMKRAAKVVVVLISLTLSMSCSRSNTIEGVWQGKVLEKKGGDTFTWVITVTKVGNDYTGQLVENGKEIKNFGGLKIEGQKISFILGNDKETKCEGVFSSGNSKLDGKCLFNLESTPDGLQKGEELMVFELTKK